MKQRQQRKNQKGFTLIELLVVVAIIAIIVAIAVPKYLNAKTTAQESAGAATTRTVGTALMAYNQKWGIFPATADLLGGNCDATTPPTNLLSCNLEDAVAQAVKNGTALGQYTVTYTQTGSGAGFTLATAPITGSAAQRNYFMNEGLSIHVKNNAAAGVGDPLL